MSYEVAAREDPAVASIADDRRRRATVALFDVLQTHLGEYTEGE